MEDYKICGLVAVISPVVQTASENKMWKDMLVIDQLRGKDSTGMFAVDTKNEVSLVKSIATPTDFLQLKKVEEAVRGARILVGHNRHATIGAVNANNAHPFNHSNITLVHNGTLDTYARLPHQSDFATDSECVAFNLSLCNDNDDTVRLLESIEGAFAFIWYDDIDQALYFIRNTERPLYSVMVNKTLMLASERGFLFAALERNGVQVKDLSVFTEVPVGELHKVTVVAGELVITAETLKLKKSYDRWAYGYGTYGTYQGKGSTGSSTKYDDDLYLELGVRSGDVLSGSIEKIDPYQNSTSGTFWVRLCDKGIDARVVLYGQRLEDWKAGDSVRVRLQSLSLADFDNRHAATTYQLTARGSQLLKNELSVVKDKPEDVEEDLVVCSCCDSVVGKDMSSLLNDGSYVCDSCIASDPVLQMYVASHLVA